MPVLTNGDERADTTNAMRQLVDAAGGVPGGRRRASGFRTPPPLDPGQFFLDFCENQKSNMTKADRYIKRLQRKLSRQKKGSSRRNKTKHRIATHHAKKANIRNDFAHKTSRSLIESKAKVIVFEALRTSSMTRKPKA